MIAETIRPPWLKWCSLPSSPATPAPSRKLAPSPEYAGVPRPRNAAPSTGNHRQHQPCRAHERRETNTIGGFHLSMSQPQPCWRRNPWCIFSSGKPCPEVHLSISKVYFLLKCFLLYFILKPDFD
ncbi:hypothetical protein D1007_53223 [Hordeum vulgare]|nr:hypothetical protein D1007_53223 [Hordeum vulgare]